MQTLSEKILHFYQILKPPEVPLNIDVLHPQRDPAVMEVNKKFYQKYYADEKPRELLFGINPGRFGAGTTGINFTAPRQLTQILNIEHDFKDQSELSAEFIYAVIDRYGGPEKFYGDFFLTAISPLGFTKGGTNMNYYDDKELEKLVTPYVIRSIQDQVEIFRPSRTAICIGGAKNFSFFQFINQSHSFFDKIIPLAHPRFIMQYRRKQMDKFIGEYLSALTELKR